MSENRTALIARVINNIKSQGDLVATIFMFFGGLLTYYLLCDWFYINRWIMQRCIDSAYINWFAIMAMAIEFYTALIIFIAKLPVAAIPPSSRPRKCS